MSDFFYKESIGPVFSPVINVKHENISKTIVSAIDNLLSPDGNMFTRAKAVKNLMQIEKLSLEETAKVLSLKTTDVANKLRLLEFSQKERCSLLENGFSEMSALEFLKLDKVSRLYAMEYCKRNDFDADGVRSYVESVIEKKNSKKQGAEKKSENVRKFVVSDIGFFFNSIENVLRLARKAGLEVDSETKETEERHDIHISVKKKSESGKS